MLCLHIARLAALLALLCALGCGEDASNAPAAPAPDACDALALSTSEAPSCGDATCPPSDCGCLGVLGLASGAPNACLGPATCLTGVDCDVACGMGALQLSACRDEALNGQASGGGGTANSATATACDDDSDCQEGQRCRANAGGYQRSLCEPLEPCDDDSDCASERCTRSASGRYCALLPIDAPCLSDSACGSGICGYNFSHPNRCTLGGLDEVCDDDSDCATYACVAGETRAFCAGRGLDSRCDDDGDCDAGACVRARSPGGGRAATGRCGDGSAGSFCAEDADCADGRSCVSQREGNTSTTRCSDGDAGAPCVVLDHCAVGLGCDPQSDTCQPRSLDLNRDCRADQECRSGICLGECKSGEPGSDCLSDAHCLSGDCDEGASLCR